MRRLTLLAAVVLALFATVGVASAAGMGSQTTGSERNYTAHLTGSGTNAQGEVIYHLSKDGMTLSYKLIVANIDNVTMAHIHDGATGIPVVWLYPSAPPPRQIPGRSDGVLAQGTITSANIVGPYAGMTVMQLFEKIEAGKTYVNVHTTAFPAGLIRTH